MHLNATAANRIAPPTPGKEAVYRWVPTSAATAYCASDAMAGRCLHWLPREVSSLRKDARKRGLSFSCDRSHWKMPDQSFCFVVDATTLPDAPIEISGQEIRHFSDEMEACRANCGSPDCLARYRELAVAASLAAPDESFVLGRINELHRHLIGIVVCNAIPNFLWKYAGAYSIPIEIKTP